MAGGQLKYLLQFDTAGLGNVTRAQEEIRKLTGAPAGNANWVAGFRAQVNGLGRDLGQLKPGDTFGGPGAAGVASFNKELALAERGLRSLGLDSLASGVGIFKGLKDGAAGWAGSLGLSTKAMVGLGGAIAAVATVGYNWYRGAIDEMEEMSATLDELGRTAEKVQGKVRAAMGGGGAAGFDSAAASLEVERERLLEARRAERAKDAPSREVLESLDQELFLMGKQIEFAKRRSEEERKAEEQRRTARDAAREEDTRLNQASDALRKALETGGRGEESRRITLRLALADGDVEKTRALINELRNEAARELGALETKGLSANTMTADEISAAAARMEELRSRIADLNLRSLRNDEEADKEHEDRRARRRQRDDDALQERIEGMRGRLNDTLGVRADVSRDSYASRGLFAAGGAGAGAAAEYQRATAEGVQRIAGQLAVMILALKAQRAVRDVAAVWGGGN